MLCLKWQLKLITVILCCILTDMIQVCPAGPVWNIRAGIKCSDEKEYHCLFDTNAKNTTTGFFVEQCLSPKQYIGKRYVLSGNLNALDCNATRYTPQPIWSYNTRNSECPFQKSLCNEEGQSVVDSGTTEIDRTCRCNYQDGYNYVIKPINPCKCFPYKEDCSCYVHHCADPTEKLSPDYKCETRNVLKFSTCNTIPLPPTHRSGEPVTPVITKSKVKSKVKSNINSRKRRTIVIFALLGTICIVLLFFLAIIKGKSLYEYDSSIDKIPKQALTDHFKEIMHRRKPETRSFKIACPERIFRGDDVHLEFVIQDKSGTSEISTVSWYFTNKASTRKEIWPENSDKYSGGTTTTPSLLIKSVDETDSGTYRCVVVFDDDTHFTSQIKLCIPEKIYIQDLPVISHYLPPDQLHDIEKAFCLGENGKKLVILEGTHGSGKSQAAHYYCMKMKDKYSVIAKILLNNILPLKEILENLASDLNFKIGYEKAVDTKTVIENIEECFMQDERKGFPYLIFIDDVDEDILTDFEDVVSFVSLVKKVPYLYIILATTNLKLKGKFEHYELVTFNGLTDGEIRTLFKNVSIENVDISSFKKVIGNMPLVVVTAIRFMMTFKFTVNDFLAEFSNESSDFSTLSYYQNIEGLDKTEYDKNTLKSQIMALSFIKKTLSEEEWQVIKLIPYFRYNYISTTVLESCFFHLTRCRTDVRRKGIQPLVNAFVNIPLCHVRYVKPARIQVLSKPKSSTINEQDFKIQHSVLMFHKVTKDAINIIGNSNLEQYDEELIELLLKIYCCEIDIDAVTDVSVERNLRFVHHAIKLLKVIEKQKQDVKKEIQVWIAYLHCAIGTTYLLERTNVAKAHFHLMKAREIALGVVKSKCDFTKEHCFYINDLKTLPQTETSDEVHTQSVMKTFVERGFDKTLCKEFILGKHRNFSDIDTIRKEIDVELDVFESHYLSEKDYNILFQKDLAMSLEDISKLFLSELLLRILHNNIMAFSELQFVINNDKESKEYQFLEQACSHESKTALILRTNIEKHFPSQHSHLYVCLRNKRSGQVMALLNSRNEPVSFDKDIQFCEELLDNPKTSFDFGIVKFARQSNIRNISMCNSVLLRLIMKQLKLEHDDEKVYELNNKGKRVMNNLLEQINEIETSDLPYTWLALPFLYIVCGDFLLLSTDQYKTSRALQYYDRALGIEKSRSVIWTRYVQEGYRGQIQCLQKLNRTKDALQTVDLAINILKGQNQKKIYETFQTLKLRIQFGIEI